MGVGARYCTEYPNNAFPGFQEFRGYFRRVMLPKPCLSAFNKQYKEAYSLFVTRTTSQGSSRLKSEKFKIPRYEKDNLLIPTPTVHTLIVHLTPSSSCSCRPVHDRLLLRRHSRGRRPHPPDLGAEGADLPGHPARPHLLHHAHIGVERHVDSARAHHLMGHRSGRRNS